MVDVSRILQGSCISIFRSLPVWEVHHLLSQTEPVVSVYHPEMALPVTGGAQPITHGLTGHVTSRQAVPPIGDSQVRPPKNAEKTGHV